jgi:hypothetical protein
VEQAIKRVMMMHSSVVAAQSGQAEQSNVVESGIKNTRVLKNDISDDVFIRLIQTKNPKKGKSASRYEFYSDNMTVGEYVEKVGDRRLAIADLRWDKERNYISWG